MKVLAFAASTSKQSINKQLVSYATKQLANDEVELIDLNDYEMPLFSVDKEADIGEHPLAQELIDKIAAVDALVISFAEHNSGYTAAYKNTLDWCSRINTKVFQDKKLIFLSTSPGKRGGANVMQLALDTAERFGGNVLAYFSLPSFNDNFDQSTQKISNAELAQALQEAMDKLSA